MVARHSDAVVKADAEGGAGRFNGVVALKEREGMEKEAMLQHGLGARAGVIQQNSTPET